MPLKPPTAFITARKGFCYLTVKIGRRNFHLMRLRNYTLDAEDKRQMPPVAPGCRLRLEEDRRATGR